MEQNGVLRPLADGLPPEVRAFTHFLQTLVASLGTPPDQYGSAALRDPDAMDRYLDGSRLPPRDVLAGLVRDLAEQRGVRLAPEAERQLHELHGAAVRAVDSGPGRVEQLRAELDTLRIAQERSARREQQLLGDVRARQAGVQGGAVDHAGYRKQLIAIHEELRRVRAQRALAEVRREELVERLAAAERRRREEAAAGRRDRPAQDRAAQNRPAQDRPAQDRPAQDRAGGTRPTGARFAGLAGARTEPERAPAAAPVRREPAAPTGARFAGAQSGRRRLSRRGEPSPRPADGSGNGSGSGDAARAALAKDPQAREVAESVIRLRGEGRAQDAQRLLWEVSAWPPERFPALLAALSATGQHGDASVLVWELSSRSPQEVAAFSAWLAKSGLPRECDDLLVHTASRPHADVAATVGALARAGWDEQAGRLLETVARVRPPEVVAGLAGDLEEAGAPGLLRTLLAAVAAGPRDRRLLIAAAMRLAGLPESADRVRG